MGLFDDIVPPDVAAGGYRPLRITVRPKGVEPPASPQPDEMPADAGFAPNQVEPWNTEGPVGKTAPSSRSGLFDDIVAPAVRVRTAGLSFGDGDKIVRQVAAPGTSAFFHDDDSIAEPPAPRAVNGTPGHLTPLIGSPMPTNIDPPTGVPIEETSKLGLFSRSVEQYPVEADNAARAGELTRHKAAIESALSNIVPLRLQHPLPVEIASALMADHGLPLDEALDRATMRLHAEEGTAEVGKISDVIGKDAFDEAQRAPASPDLAQPAQGVGPDRTAAEEQARPDGEHAPGDRAAQGGEAAGGKTIGSEGAGSIDDRSQPGHEPASLVEREQLVEGLKFGKGEKVIAQAPAGKQTTMPSALDSSKDAAGDSGSGLMRDIESYLGNSAAALARIPRDLSKMAGDLVSGPVDFLQRAGPSLAGLGMSVPLLRVGTPRGQPIVNMGGAGAVAAPRAAAGGRNPFGIGPYAGESIPARSAARNFTRAERAEINRIGVKTGCHTCGTKNPGTKYGNFVLDHQTPSALNWEGAPQRLYPHCLACSDAQGLGIIRLLPRLRGPR